MSVVYVLLPLALLGAVGWAMTFVWTVRRGQLEDLDGAAWRILGDDEVAAQELRAETHPRAKTAHSEAQGLPK